METDYNEELILLVRKKKKDIPASFSENAVAHIFTILESTPTRLTAIAERFDEKKSLEPILKDKRSFRETLIHMLNMEGLNYSTIYPAYLLKKPTAYPLHAERDFGRLGLFSGFDFLELLAAFRIERRKTLNFLRSLKKGEWQRELIEESKASEVTIYERARELALHDFTHARILDFQTGAWLSASR